MKEFDLEKARSGAEVITKSGQEAKILLFNRSNKTFPLVVILENKNVFYKDKPSDNDLIMKL